jgi:hypothetical protein
MISTAPSSVHISFLRRPWVGSAVAVIIILAAGGWGLVQPQWLRWQNVAEQKAAAAETVQQLTDTAQQLTTIADQYQVIRRDAVRSVGRLDTLVASRIDNARLFSEFQQLVEQTGLVLVSVRISPDPKSNQPQVTLLSLSVSGGNYPALKRLLQVLERNLRLTDVVTLTFDAQVQTYSITARVYSFE